MPAEGSDESLTPSHHGPLRPVAAVLLALGAVGAFHAAFMGPALCWLVLGYLGCLFAVRRLTTAPQAFYVGLAIGLGVFVPQMGFLWTIFQAAAIPLWLILALFHAGFLLLLNRVEFRLGTKWAVILAPVLWCGIEYFRSEVWWLRFAWFTAGSSLHDTTLSLPVILGVYGIGFGLLGFVGLGFLAASSLRWRLSLTVYAFTAAVLGALTFPPLMAVPNRRPDLKVAGLQLEFPAIPDVLAGLDKLANAHPDAELLMLSEYTFADGPPPPSVKTWCRKNRKWLVVGGKMPISDSVFASASVPTNSAVHTAQSAFQPGLLTSAAAKERFYNTAFVISTNGEVVFTQAKSRPIQFFNDGEPAPMQRVWDSPWGKLGIAICYDASYRQVMDELIRQGAVALLIPTMDVTEWGEHQHRLNARMARLRAAEYRVPIFRVASSGVSQVIARDGREIATAPFPGQGEMIAGELRWSAKGGTVPLDAWLAPACTWATGGVMLWLAGLAWRERRQRKAAK
jgi:apolipoprotein N-acyltransferase